MILSEIRTNYQNLLAVANSHMPARLAYGVAKNLKKLETEVEFIEKQRISIAENYAKKDESGASVVVDGRFVFEKSEDEEAFKKEFSDLLKTETELYIHKCPCTVLDMLDDPQYDFLTPAQMVALDFMIEQEADLQQNT